jgi:hypothetical protein
MMLAGGIVPLHKGANLDLNHDGTGVVSRGYAESVNCGLTALADGGMSPGAWPPQLYGTWGNHQDVLVSVDPSTSELTSLLLQGDYAGTISFGSRVSGSYGNHSYTIGVGHLDRDGTPLTIDWTSQSPFNELFDGLTATFVPAYASVLACVATAGCYWGSASPGTGGDGGEDSYYFVVSPLHLAVYFDTVAQGGLPTGIQIELPDGLPAGTLDGGGGD